MGKRDQINSRLVFVFGSSPTIDECWLEPGVGERLTNARSLLSDRVIPGNDGRIMSPERTLTAFTPLPPRPSLSGGRRSLSRIYCGPEYLLRELLICVSSTDLEQPPLHLLIFWETCSEVNSQMVDSGRDVVWQG